jgi:hypothetical protein
MPGKSRSRLSHWAIMDEPTKTIEADDLAERSRYALSAKFHFTARMSR